MREKPISAWDYKTNPSHVGAKLFAWALCIVLSACANPRPQALDEAEAAVSSARADSEIQRFAADELAEAEQSLERAEGAWQNNAATDEIEHLAYLTEQRVAIAGAVAEQEEANEEIRGLSEEVERVRLEAREREVQVAEQRARQAELEVSRLQQELREVKAERTDRGLVLTLGNILFDVDRAQLKPGGVQQLVRVGDFLRENADRNVVVEGHTDSTGSASYNQDLSQRRANAVADFLIAQGISNNRTVARGYGEQFPVATNETTAGRQQNRRVEIVVLDKGEPLPSPRARVQ